jgi:hypothetical protein
MPSPFASLFPVLGGASFGAPEELATRVLLTDELLQMESTSATHGLKRTHDGLETLQSYDNPENESLSNMRPRLSTPDAQLPFSPLDLSDFQQTKRVKVEDTSQAWTSDQGPVIGPAAQQSRLGSWADNLSFADQQIALRFLQLPTDTLVETMFQIKSRYERKVRTIVNSLKDDLQFSKDTNTVLLNQLVESNQRETFLSDTLTSTLSQLVQKEQAYQVQLNTTQILSAQLQTAQSQLTELQGEADRPEVQWSERKDIIQIDVGVSISVQTVNWKVIFPATLDNLTLSIVNKIVYIKNIWKRSLPANEITKIEYIMNEDLYVQFKTAKSELERLNRPSTEKILFHGTAVGNINRY